jgi:integrase
MIEHGWRRSDVEPMTGIEPAYSAWEADVLPLNYIGDVAWEG